MATLLPALWVYVCVGRFHSGAYERLSFLPREIKGNFGNQGHSRHSYLLPDAILVSRRGGGVPTACGDASVCGCGFLVLDAVIVRGGRTQ